MGRRIPLVVLAAIGALAAGCARPPAAAAQAGATAASAATGVSAASTTSPRSPASPGVLRGDGLLAFSGGGKAGLDALYTAEPDGSVLRRLPIPAGLHPFARPWAPDGRGAGLLPA